MRTEAPPDGASIEIIEIIDDGIDPFGDRPQHTTIHDTGGPRWVGPAAAAALVALIGYGIATSASTSSTPKVAQAPSTTVSPRTTPPTTQPTPTTVPPPVVPYYSADPPREYRVQFAEIETSGRERFFPGYNYQLWATPGAAAATGSWFAIESFRTNPQSIYAVDAFRVTAGDQSMVISHMASGQSTIQFSIDDLVSVTITALGWGDEDLVRLAQSVTLAEAGTDGADVRPSDPALIDNYQLLSVMPPYIAIRGYSVEEVYYSVASEPNSGLYIGVAPLDPDDRGTHLADRQVALRFVLDRTTPFEVDGHSAVAGAIFGQPEQTLATWIAGDHIVTVGGTMPLSELITIARTVHEVSSNEWEGMQFQATRGNGFSGDHIQSSQFAVSSGTDSLGTWRVRVNMTTLGDQHGVNWQWPSGGGFQSIAADTARVTTVVDAERTYVLADLPRAIAPSGQLQVTLTGLDPVSVPFTDTDPSLDRTFAAYAFSEASNYTAQIVGPDGAVLATWPST